MSAVARAGSISSGIDERRRRLAAALTSALIAVCAVLALAPARAEALGVGIQDNSFFTNPIAPLASQAMAQIHGSWLRIILRWSIVAPAGSVSPAGFDASNPADPNYHWIAYDAYLKEAAAAHLKVIVALAGAPGWAEGPNNPGDPVIGPGAWDPDPTQFGVFAHAAAERYSGTYPDPHAPGQALPRIKYWEIWNEENLPEDLGAPDPVTEYRSLLNAGYQSIKGVDPTNVVSIGGLAPVGFPPPRAVAPLKFAAQLMCLRRVRTKFVRRRPCPVRASFDAVSIHPYTLAATPTTHADAYNDLLLADTGKIVKLVQTARKLKTVTNPREKRPLWVTEWSWFTDPPNQIVGDAPVTAARYVDDSMWLMWHFGVKIVIWFTVEDPPGLNQTQAQFVTGGGLFTSDGQPKPMFQAFAFPIYASVDRHRRGYVWGRAPVGGHQRVVIERIAPGNRWIRAGTAFTRADGTFVAHLRHGKRTVYRARIPHGAVSLGYRAVPIKPGRTHAGIPT
jgi:hypothetical protein